MRSCCTNTITKLFLLDLPNEFIPMLGTKAIYGTLCKRNFCCWPIGLNVGIFTVHRSFTNQISGAALSKDWADGNNFGTIVHACRLLRNTPFTNTHTRVIEFSVLLAPHPHFQLPHSHTHTQYQLMGVNVCLPFAAEVFVSCVSLCCVGPVLLYTSN